MNRALTFHGFSKAVSLVTLITLLILWPSQASAQTTTLYVSPDGNDSWSGAAASRAGNSVRGPFATIQRAQEEVRALNRGQQRSPVTVYLRGGTYQQDEAILFTSADSGSSGAPVRYENYRGETPVISGGRKITGWQYYRDGLWFTDLPEVRAGEWYFRELFVDGERRTRARTPNKGYYYVDELLDGNKLGTRIDRFRYAAGNIYSNWKNLQDIEVVALHHWVDVRLPIESVDAANRIVHFQKKTGLNLFEQGGEPARYYIESVFEALDIPGEWYLDRHEGRLFYWPLEGEDLTGVDVYAPYTPELLRVEGSPEALVEHITFRGLTFTHSVGVQWDDDSEGGSLADAAVNLQYARRISFEGCVFENLGGYALDMLKEASFNRVSGSTFRYLGAGGIKLEGGYLTTGPWDEVRITTHDNEIIDNRFHHLGEVFPSGRAIFVMQSSSNRIAHNEISHMRYSAIQVGFTWSWEENGTARNIIEHNHIHHIADMPNQLSDLGAITTSGRMPGTIIRNNLIHDIGAARHLAFGIYLDGYSGHLTIENNVVYNIQDGPFLQTFGRDNTVSNNIFAFGGTSQMHLGNANNSQGTLRFERNIILWDGTASPVSGAVTGSHFSSDRNTYFRTDGGQILFGKETLTTWRQRGHDLQSRIADPMVQLTEGGVLIDPSSPAIALGFQAIDIGSVGPGVSQDEDELPLVSRRRTTRPGSSNTTGSGN